MYKFQIIGLLVIVGLTQDTSNSYYLSPPLPPSAYLGEYYTVQFRVIGMANPIFSFDNVPACFAFSADGTIEGTPNVTGSFAIRANFQSSEGSSSKNIVIRVAQATKGDDQLLSQAGNQAKMKFMIASNNKKLTYLVGDQIVLLLQAINGKQPYTWNYISLPAQLTGNASGVVTGVFDHEGYYTFSASACDSLGSMADSYFTLNIQPVTAKALSFTQVPNIVTIRYNLQQVYDQQIAATNALFQALKNLYQVQNQTNQARDAFNETNAFLKSANDTAKTAEERIKNATTMKQSASSNQTKAKNLLIRTQNKVALAHTNFSNAYNFVQSNLQKIAEIQNLVRQLDTKLSEASVKFIQAQTASSEAAEVFKLVLAVDISARNDYNIAFGTLSNRKQSLQSSQNQLQFAASIVANTKNAVNLARQMNDNAQSNLTEAQGVYQMAKSGLFYANEAASSLRGDLSDAADELGTAQFNLHQATSVLYVAQARKEQADKATEIVRMQTSSQASINMFSGCDQQAYPTITGSAIVLKVSSYGFQLSTGSLLLYGNCTQSDSTVMDGDIITYIGYLKSGFVQCTFFKKNQ